jgi:hypothetical protein
MYVTCLSVQVPSSTYLSILGGASAIHLGGELRVIQQHAWNGYNRACTEWNG